MAKNYEVLEMLIPQGGWATTGETFDDILFLECKPISKKQFEDGCAKYDSWKSEKDAAKAQAKAELLERLGITEDEAKLLLS